MIKKMVAIFRRMERCVRKPESAQKLKRTKGNINVHIYGASIKKTEGSGFVRL